MIRIHANVVQNLTLPWAFSKPLGDTVVQKESLYYLHAIGYFVFFSPSPSLTPPI